MRKTILGLILLVVLVMGTAEAANKDQKGGKVEEKYASTGSFPLKITPPAVNYGRIITATDSTRQSPREQAFKHIQDKELPEVSIKDIGDALDVAFPLAFSAWNESDGNLNMYFFKILMAMQHPTLPSARNFWREVREISDKQKAILAWTIIFYIPTQQGGGDFKAFYQRFEANPVLSLIHQLVALVKNEEQDVRKHAISMAARLLATGGPWRIQYRRQLDREEWREILNALWAIGFNKRGEAIDPIGLRALKDSFFICPAWRDEGEYNNDRRLLFHQAYCFMASAMVAFNKSNKDADNLKDEDLSVLFNQLPLSTHSFIPRSLFLRPLAQEIHRKFNDYDFF